ncbi:hypothetical protein [Propylenella binzhouense]|uniref:Uncharacterized protein n=1 Tax=Propylenella binzhouense TaxID=2555902 RepID=A0A964T899_9HYPH|nr:hypothetical protein [Propylenella binzhouense]MYZ50353.1 hypothetical protein [Propylenella binzhouense]
MAVVTNGRKGIGVNGTGRLQRVCGLVGAALLGTAVISVPVLLLAVAVAAFVPDLAILDFGVARWAVAAIFALQLLFLATEEE